MPRYSLEPWKGFTHVLRSYTDADNYCYIRLFKDGLPFDYSAAKAISFRVGEEKFGLGRCDISKREEGIVGINLKGCEVGGHLVPIMVKLPNEGMVCFGKVPVFVEDISTGSDIPVFHYEPEADYLSDDEDEDSSEEDAEE